MTHQLSSKQQAEYVELTKKIDALSSLISGAPDAARAKVRSAEQRTLIARKDALLPPALKRLP